MLDIISGTGLRSEELIISREEFVDNDAKMGEILSSLEWKVLLSYLEGKSYQEIAVDLKRHVKSIDNALQRGETQTGALPGTAGHQPVIAAKKNLTPPVVGCYNNICVCKRDMEGFPSWPKGGRL